MSRPEDARELIRLAKTGGRLQRTLINWRMGWIEKARPKQLPPDIEYDIWLLLAGRGFGKTRVGAEELGYRAASRPGTRWAVIAPTQNDCRKVCFEGESGLENVLPPAFIKKYSASDIEIELVNGSLISGKSAEKPDRLRGPQFHGGWCDEIAAWPKLQETWDNYVFGARLGDNPQTILTTTPRPIEFLRQRVKDPRTVVTTGSTFDNAANLAPSALRTFREIYEGTRKGQQELHAVILETNENALWKPSQIDLLGVDEDELPEFVRIVVAVDPAVTTEDDSDETGIICAGLGFDGLIYVLDDMSGHYSPLEWARIVANLYDRRGADLVVAETNQGGDLVTQNIATVDASIGVKKIHAKRGKYLRAEPVAAYYEKGKVRHCGPFVSLEKQMVNYTGSTVEKSPDRLDALVYAIGELMQGTIGHAVW